MLQYLLNATVIWAICLLVYEALLKGETYHQWNRIYLLLSLVAGLIIPLIHLQSNETVAAATAQTQELSVSNIMAAKSNLIQQSAISSPTEQAVNWIWIVYFAGVSLTLFLLAKDAVALIINYRKGTRRKIGRFTIIETNKPGGPYSFFNVIFINNWQQHSEAEWQMMLQHEYRHAQLKHGFDLILLNLMQAALWFHPLIYHFKNRLRLVHEYQADEIARDNYTSYGTFLIEQNLLHTTPFFAHSFYHSPIKNRIIMLTKNASTTSHKAKYLLAIPMLLTFMLACTHKGATLEKVSHEKVRTGNKETFKGNVFEYAGPDESVELKTPNGEVQSLIVTGEPIKINGEQIYKTNKVTVAPKYDGDQSNMVKLVFDKIKDKLNTFEDGEYHIALFTPIIDKKGNFAYYFVRGVEGPGYPIGEPEPKNYYRVPEELQKELVQEIETALDAMKFKPAQLDGKAVNAQLDGSPVFNQKIIVKNHKAILTS